MTSYRIYGPSTGVGSFVTITDGFREGFRELGHDAAFFPTDLHDDEDRPEDGATADVAIWLGWPTHSEKMRFFGSHRDRFVMVAPNSTWSPPFVFNSVKAADATMITPSSWGRTVLEAQRPGAVSYVVPHGVGREFWAWKRDVRQSRRQRDEGLLFLHVTSTTSERKGTLELLAAWERLMARGYPGLLTIATDDAGRRHLKQRASIPDAVRIVVPRVKSGEMPAFMDAFDVIVQPSRSEGFGLVPLEAACLGKPVIMTDCTGHSEFSRSIVFTPVPSGPLAEIMDYEGSEAPSVSPSDIIGALDHVKRYFHHLSAQAWDHREEVYDQWKWSSVLRPFIQATSQKGR